MMANFVTRTAPITASTAQVLADSECLLSQGGVGQHALLLDMRRYLADLVQAEQAARRCHCQYDIHGHEFLRNPCDSLALLYGFGFYSQCCLQV